MRQVQQLQKQCPQCGTTVLDAAYCPICRHQYRTQFANRTQAIPILAQQRPAWEPLQLLTIVVLTLIGSCCVVYIWQASRPQVSAAVVTSAVQQTRQR